MPTREKEEGASQKLVGLLQQPRENSLSIAM